MQCLKLKFCLQPGMFISQGSMTVCLFYISQRCMLPRANAAEFTFSQWAFREFSWNRWDLNFEMRQKRLKQHWSHLISEKRKKPKLKPNYALTAILLSAPDWGWRRKTEGHKAGRGDDAHGRAGWVAVFYPTSSTSMPHFIHGHRFGAWEGEVDRNMIGHLQYQLAKHPVRTPG